MMMSMNIEPNPLVEKVESCLALRDYAGLYDEIFKASSIPHIHAEGMDLITKICENGLAFAEDNASISACTNSLNQVVFNYRPKEALICLLEQGEAFVHSDKFTCLLPALQFVMLNLPKKREKTFSWVLSTLRSHMKYFHELPEELKKRFYEGDDLVLLEQDPRIKSILIAYKEYIDFYSPFVEQLEHNSLEAEELGNSEEILSIQRQRGYLRDYIVDLLGTPLIHLNLDWDEESVKGKYEDQRSCSSHKLTSCGQCGHGYSAQKPKASRKIGPKVKSDARLIAETMMALLEKVDLDPAYYFKWIETRVAPKMELKVPEKSVKSKEVNETTHDAMEIEDEEEEEEEVVVTMSSVASYFYLIFDQNLNSAKIPAILSPAYMFNTILHPVTTIIKNVNNCLAVKKALGLTFKFLDSCDITMSTNSDHRLHCDLLKTEIHKLFVDRLAYLAVYCEARSIRHQAYELLRKYLWAFEPQGRYDCLNLIFNTVPNDSLVGHMITELKQFIFIAYDPHKSTSEEGMELYFLGPSLQQLLANLCNLKDGVTTDLCQNSNKLISALNLLRFLLVRDGKENRTGILDMFPKIEKVMFDPLRKALDLSRAHYELKLKEITDPYLRKERENEEKRMFESMANLEVGGVPMKPGDISMDEQKASVIAAINTFDHMTGLLAWVYEAHPDPKRK